MPLLSNRHGLRAAAAAEGPAERVGGVWLRVDVRGEAAGGRARVRGGERGGAGHGRERVQGVRVERREREVRGRGGAAAAADLPTVSMHALSRPRWPSHVP